MHTGILTPFIAGMQPQHTADDSMRDLLEDINEKLQILIEIQQARQPPFHSQPEVRAERDEIDISWIDPHRWYDNGQFCRIFDIAKITAQKWSYILYQVGQKCPLFWSRDNPLHQCLCVTTQLRSHQDC